MSLDNGGGREGPGASTRDTVVASFKVGQQQVGHLVDEVEEWLFANRLGSASLAC